MIMRHTETKWWVEKTIQDGGRQPSWIYRYLCLPIEVLLDILVTIFHKAGLCYCNNQQKMIWSDFSRQPFWNGGHLELGHNWKRPYIQKYLFYNKGKLWQVSLLQHKVLKMAQNCLISCDCSEKYHNFSISTLSLYLFIIQLRKVTPRRFHLIMIIQVFLEEVCLVL